MRAELWITEGVLLRAVCRDPAELITELCRRNVAASDFIACGEGAYTFYVRPGDADRAIRIGSRAGTEVTVLRKRGALHFLRRFRRRLYLLLLPLPFLAAFLVLSTFLWEFDVTGCETLSRAEVLTALEAAGVYPGVSGLRLDNAQIRSRMQASLPELAWCTVQVHGSRALVVIRERREPPEIIDESLEREVAAAKPGVIERLSVLQGKAAVKRGEAVLAGQTLISGSLTDRQGDTRRVHAQGRVLAQTWVQQTLELPLTVREKVYTGEKSVSRALVIGDLRLNFGFGSRISYESYDTINRKNRVGIFGLRLPITVIREEAREYRLIEGSASEEESRAVLEARLMDRLRRELPKAEIRNTQFSAELAGESIRVTLLAECLEDIGFERAISP